MCTDSLSAGAKQFWTIVWSCSAARPWTKTRPSPILRPMVDAHRHRQRALAVALAAGLPISAVFLWLAVRDADLGAVARTVGEARPAPLAGALACLALVYWLQAVRWRRIARVEVGRRRVLELVIAAVAVNNVVPGRVGDLLRARWISRAGNLPGGRGLASVVLDRGSDVIVLTGLLLVSLPLVTDEPWVDRIVVAAVAVAACFVAGILAAHAYARRRPRERRAERKLLRRLARDTLDGLSEPVRPLEGVLLLVLGVGAWLAWAGAASFCAWSVGIELSLVEAVFVTGAINLGVAIPSSPGFVGTYQWLAVSALALFGVERGAALAFAVVLQASWYIPTTLLGGALLVARMRGRARVSASRRGRSRGAEGVRHSCLTPGAVDIDGSGTRA